MGRDRAVRHGALHHRPSQWLIICNVDSPFISPIGVAIRTGKVHVICTVNPTGCLTIEGTYLTNPENWTLEVWWTSSSMLPVVLRIRQSP